MLRPSIFIHLAAVVLILVIAGCATLPKDFDRPESYALADTENTLFGKLLANEKADHPGISGFHLLPEGLDAFVARAVLAYPVSVLVKGGLPTPDEVGKLRDQLTQFIVDQNDSAYLRALRNSDLANKFRNDRVDFYWGDSEVVFDEPEKLQHAFSQTQYHLAPDWHQFYESLAYGL